MKLLGIASLITGLIACGAGTRPTPADAHDLESSVTVDGGVLAHEAPDASGEAAEPPPVTEEPTEPLDAGTPVPWVSPGRCALPCADAPTDLVTVDGLGRPSSTGVFRVRAEAAASLQAMLEDAARAGHALSINSAYRSYTQQDAVFGQYLASPGRAARPGHSEHQLGLAVDIQLPTYAGLSWLERSCHRYGFVLSYPSGKQRVTGYQYEAWHVRYVGDALAERLTDWNVTLEEYLQANPDQGLAGDCSDCPTSSARAPCGAITEAGTCAGTVLQWCFDGMLAQVDCRVAGQVCKLDPGLSQYDCLAP